MKKRFTIIIPSKNSANFIKRNIKSVLKQDFPKEFYEVILVDHNSTDKTLGLVKELLFNSEIYFQIFNFNNGVGPGLLRNLGLSKANGEYILFVDSDDELSPQALRTLDILIETNKNPDTITFRAAEPLSVANKSHFQKPVIEYKNYDNYIPEKLIRQILRIEIVDNIIFNAFRSRFLFENKFTFEDGIYEDCLFQVKTLLNSKNHVNSEEVLYIKHTRLGQITQHNDIAKAIKYLYIRKKIFDYINSKFEQTETFFFEYAFGIRGVIANLIELCKTSKDPNQAYSFLKGSILNFPNINKIMNCPIVTVKDFTAYNFFESACKERDTL